VCFKRPGVPACGKIVVKAQELEDLVLGEATREAHFRETMRTFAYEDLLADLLHQRAKTRDPSDRAELGRHIRLVRAQIRGGSDPAEPADRELAELQVRLERVESLAQDGTIGEAEYLAAVGALRGLIRDKERALARPGRTRVDWQELLRRVEEWNAPREGDRSEWWVEHPADLQGTQNLIRSVLARVEVGPALKGRNRFDPDRVTFVWKDELGPPAPHVARPRSSTRRKRG
jgi:hypothetical protein